MRTLIKRPFFPLRNLQEEINQLFEEPYFTDRNIPVSACDWQPSLDIKEEPDKFVVKADIPGVELKDISLSIQEGALIISGQRESEVKSNKEGYHRVERSFGKFYRRIYFPEGIDEEKIKASGKQGVVEITLPKIAKKLPKQVKIEG